MTHSEGGDPREEFDPALELPMEPFQFSNETLNELRAIIGADDSDFRREILPELQAIATSFRRWIAQGEATPSRAETNMELKKLAADAKAFATRLRSVDNDVLFEVMRRFERDATGRESRCEQLAWELDNLARAVRQAYRARASQSGPDTKWDHGLAIRLLVDLYERKTRKRATHNPSRDSIYDGTPRSEAGRFVQAFFRDADPREGPGRISDSAISSALAALIRERNRVRRNRKVPPSKSG